MPNFENMKIDVEAITKKGINGLIDYVDKLQEKS